VISSGTLVLNLLTNEYSEDKVSLEIRGVNFVNRFTREIIMRKRVIVLGIPIILIVALLASLSAGCSGAANGAKTTKPPQIPPQSTFVMDFSDFTEDKISFNPNPSTGVVFVGLLSDSVPAAIGLNALGDRTNWGFAVLNVGFWNLVGFVGLAIPVAAFVESIHQTPIKQPDNSWVWTYSITVQEVTYTAELHGKYMDSGVRWEMYITKQNEYTDYLWYYGESNSDNTEGYWILKEKPAKANDLLRIDWHRNSANETGDIKYTNIVPDGAENGGYISFTVSRNEPYNRAYTIFNKGKNETTYIEWSSSTKAGRVKDSSHFGYEEWHYWDSSLKNVSSQ